MNRKERRSTAKHLGILKYQKTLPRNEKFELIRENIISGRKMHEEFIENAIITREEAEDNLRAYKLNKKALDLSRKTGKTIDEALEVVTKEQNKKEKRRNKLISK